MILAVDLKVPTNSRCSGSEDAPAPSEHAAVMSRFMRPDVHLTQILRQSVTTKYFIIFFYLFCSLVLTLKNGAKAHLYQDLKYVLLWTEKNLYPFDILESGQKAFISNNCSMINCFVTSDRNFFGGDLKKFDAIAFNGQNIKQITSNSQLPSSRFPHQKYIYVNTESASNYPVCNKIFDGYFNWTMTYRLDSDIIYYYILIRNIYGEIVGPKKEMEWVDIESDEDDRILYRLQDKREAAAWFVSHCSSKSKRDQFVSKLKRALKQYGYGVDVYGHCGTLKCPRSQQSECNEMLGKNYYFYMSLENSFAEDYVTEKVLTALHHDVIPIVYGGADYSRFLPPGSYINGLEYSAEDLAKKMYELILSPKLYLKYFQWKANYKYQYSKQINVCSFCKALSNKSKMETYSSYPELRKWWNPPGDECG